MNMGYINSAYRALMFRIWQQGGLILRYKINVLVGTQLVSTSKQQFLM